MAAEDLRLRYRIAEVTEVLEQHQVTLARKSFPRLTAKAAPVLSGWPASYNRVSHA